MAAHAKSLENAPGIKRGLILPNAIKSRFNDLTPRRWRALLLPALITALVVLPIGLLVLEILHPTPELWRHLWATILPAMIQHTLLLMGGVGLLTFLLGTGLAWLVTAYEFPARMIFERLLLLPLAVPSFVMGFVFVAIFDFAGPVQTQWREWFGRKAYFPPIRSGEGVIIVMSLVLYPYVYLLARAAFREQAATTYEAAQVMGYSRRATFFRLVLPLARPSLVAGVTLAMMEAMTDFATVRFFSYPTLSEGVVRIWDGRMDRQGATELATLLLFFAFALIALERLLRGSARYYQTAGKGRPVKRHRLKGWKSLLAIFTCLVVLFFAFLLPVAQLGSWVYQQVTQQSNSRWDLVYQQYIENSLTFATTATVITLLLALLTSYGIHISKGRLPKLLGRLATLGYAMPGAVIAAGVLLTIAPIDHKINDWSLELGGGKLGLILTGSMTGLIYAYIVRYMAVAYNSVESSMDKITPNMEEAARTMGAKSWRVLRRVHLPLVSQGLAAGAMLVFVDVMKELPATLLLRPFGMDTLAVWAYMAASEAYWKEAAIPALTILLVGLLPVVLLMRLGENQRKVH